MYSILTKFSLLIIITQDCQYDKGLQKVQGRDKSRSLEDGYIEQTYTILVLLKCKDIFPDRTKMLTV